MKNRIALHFLTVVLVGATILGAAPPALPLLAQDGDIPATPEGARPAVELGIAPGAAPQPGAVRAGADDPLSAAEEEAAPGSGPYLLGPIDNPAAVMAEVPPDEYGVTADAAPQAEPFLTQSLFLPLVGATASAQPSAVTPSAPDGTVYAYSARTADAANTTKTTFTVGNTIRYIGVAYNSTGYAQSTYFVWLAAGPCGTSTLWAGYLNAAPGYSQWYIQGSAPNCPGTHTFTFQTTYYGYTTARSATFTVNSAGSVTMSSVATQDNTGVARTSFARGASIRYVAYLNNTTGSARSATLTYSVAGPCGAGTLWTGTITAAAGVQGWALDRTTPNCVGTFTYTARVTYNGAVSSRSITFTVYEPATVAVTAVRTGDRANYTRTTFTPGALMRYFGTFSNNTGATRAAYAVWSIAGPGCSGTLWAGTVNVAVGTQEWYLDGVAPACIGAYTFSLSVTYSGNTTTRSSTFSVVR